MNDWSAINLNDAWRQLLVYYIANVCLIRTSFSIYKVINNDAVFFLLVEWPTVEEDGFSWRFKSTKSFLKRQNHGTHFEVNVVINDGIFGNFAVIHYLKDSGYITGTDSKT